MGDKQLLELAAIVRSAGLHKAITACILNGDDVVLSPRDLYAIVRAAANLGKAMGDGE